MATKKGKKAAAFYPISGESRARYRHQSLLQDYQELLNETAAKRKQLERAKQKKLQLHSEVKFLRRKYKSLSINPSGKMSCKLKKRPLIMLPHFIHGRQPSMTSTQTESPKKQNTHILKEASIPSTSGGIDLNQVSLPNDDEMEEIQLNWEPLNIDKSKRRLVEGEALPNDLKLSICRDVGNNGPSRAGKRKITWQDQVVLKV